MMRRGGSAVLAGVLLLVSAARLEAQAWDAPSFFSPRSHDDLGLYAFVPEHGSWGVQAIWRQSGNLNLGVRAGLGDDLVLLGAEFYGPLPLAASPLMLAWQVGLGAGFNDRTLLRVPAGVSIGLDLGAEGSPQLLPYVFPRVALEVAAVDVGDREETEVDLGFAIDLGADFTMSPEIVLRGGVTLADRSAFGVGVAYRMQRRIVVR
jgi:hypothetical protein